MTWEVARTDGSTTWYMTEGQFFDEWTAATEFFVVDTREAYTDADGVEIAAQTYVFAVDGGNGGPDSGHYPEFFQINFTFENFINGDFGIFLPGFGASRLGTAGNDHLAGNDSDDTVEALDGDDRIYGTLGADRIDGGEGSDWVDYRDQRVRSR